MTPMAPDPDPDAPMAPDIIPQILVLLRFCSENIGFLWRNTYFMKKISKTIVKTDIS
jgi:hypothetical protein